MGCSVADLLGGAKVFLWGNGLRGILIMNHCLVLQSLINYPDGITDLWFTGSRQITNKQSVEIRAVITYLCLCAYLYIQIAILPPFNDDRCI